MRNMLALFWAVAAAALLGSTSSSAARVLSQTNSSSVDLPFVNWPTLLGPTITDEDSARNYCAQVGLQCTELLIQEMRRRYNGLKGTCDHNAVFSLLYLRVTGKHPRSNCTALCNCAQCSVCCSEYISLTCFQDHVVHRALPAGAHLRDAASAELRAVC